MVDGTPTSVSFNSTTKQVEFAVAPSLGAELTWSGRFYIRALQPRRPAVLDRQRVEHRLHHKRLAGADRRAHRVMAKTIPISLASTLAAGVPDHFVPDQNRPIEGRLVSGLDEHRQGRGLRRRPRRAHLFGRDRIPANDHGVVERPVRGQWRGSIAGSGLSERQWHHQGHGPARPAGRCRVHRLPA